MDHRPYSLSKSGYYYFAEKLSNLIVPLLFKNTVRAGSFLSVACRDVLRNVCKDKVTNKRKRLEYEVESTSFQRSSSPSFIFHKKKKAGRTAGGENHASRSQDFTQKKPSTNVRVLRLGCRPTKIA